MTLVLAKGAEITGRIVVEGEASAVDWRRISLDMLPSRDNVNRLSFGGTRASLEKDLTFKIANHPEGPYHLIVMLPPGNHYVSSIRFEGQDITDRPIELRSNDRLDGVEVRVSSEGAQIRGVVEKNESGQPAKGVTVLVFAAEPQQREFPRASPGRFKRTRADVFFGRTGPGEISGVRLGRSPGAQ